MQFRLSEYSFTHAGQLTDSQGAPRQEDYAYPAGADGPTDSTLFVVCDGMGGDGLGYAAAKAACGAIVSVLSQAETHMSRQLVYDAFDKAYHKVAQSAGGVGGQVGTTAVCLKFFEGGAIAAHLGDSRVYHIRPGETADNTAILYRTSDHTYPDERRMLTKAILASSDRHFIPDTEIMTDVRPGDCFLVCTDGALENITDEYLKSIFSHDGGSMVNKKGLLAKASANSYDNSTAIIVGVLEVIDAAKPKSIEIDPEPAAIIVDPAPTPTLTPINHKNMNANTTPTLSLPVKLAILFIGILAIMMLVYSLFIRHDEQLQVAGTAIDQTLDMEQQETFGYEITSQDIKNDALPVTVEEESVEDTDELPEDADSNETEPVKEDKKPAERNTPDKAASPADEPILQF